MSNQLGFEVLVNHPMEPAIEAVTALLKAEGFGILTRIDVRTTFKEKIGAEFRPYVILGACNPNLAHQALDADAWLGLLLPCNVTIEEAGQDACLVRIANPGMMAAFSQAPEKLAEIAQTATLKLQNIVDSLSKA